MNKILVVCEDKPFRTSLTKTLAKEGYQVEAVPGIGQLGEMWRPSEYDLVIWDVGTATNAEVRQIEHLREQFTKLLVVSTDAWNGHLKSEELAYFLQRPVKRDALLRKVREILS